MPPINAQPVSSILDAELNRLNTKKTNIDATMTAQGRLLSLNDSYRKKYSRYTQMMGIFVICVILFLLVNAIPKIFPAMPQIVIDVLDALIVVVGLYQIISIYMEINSRSNVAYDELDIPPSVDPSANMVDFKFGQDDKSEFDTEALYALLAQYGVTTCFGGQCCPKGYRYDQTQNICVNATASFTTLEGASMENRDPNSPLTYSDISSGESSLGGTLLNNPISTTGERFIEERFILPKL